MAFRDFRLGVVDMLPLIIAFVPIGALWGALAAGKGLSPAEAALMSAGVFAGASQFVAVELWRDPAPILVLAFTVFIVNVRHFLMSASLSRHMGAFPNGTRGIAVYFMCDEAWAMAERRALTQELTLPYYLGLALSAYFTWLFSSIAGAVFGARFGDPAAYGIDFAFSAMFIAILAGFWKGPRTGAVLGASAFAAAMAKLFVPGVWYIVIGGLAGVAVAAALYEEETVAA
jgi:4-azaleucine resistance transporter AzlC